MVPIKASLRGICYRGYATTVSTARSSAPHRWSPPPSSATIGDDKVAQLACRPLHSLTLTDLMRHGQPPLSESSLLSSANFTLSLLPIRLARRIQALRNLPYIVVSNPHIARIYDNYQHSLAILQPYTAAPIATLADETAFTDVLADLVQTHVNTIPTLARGFLECRKYISPVDITSFLDEHLRARIGTRLIAEQHIALHLSSQQSSSSSSSKTPNNDPDHLSQNYIGAIDTSLQPSETVLSCSSFVSELCELKYGVRPSLVINGQPDARFAYVPVHLEYILTELLKNAFRATVESDRRGETQRRAPPVEVTITTSAATGTTTDASVGAFGIVENLPSTPDEEQQQQQQQHQGVTIRIRDRGGGISPDVLPNIWAYSFTTFSEDDEVDALDTISNASAGGVGGGSSTLAGLGYGLPLSRAYAEYFGGSIAVQSMWGWGTDVYLRLNGVGVGADRSGRR